MNGKLLIVVEWLQRGLLSQESDKPITPWDILRFAIQVGLLIYILERGG